MPPIPPPPYPPPPPLLRHDWDWLARFAPVVRASASRFRLCTVLESTREAAALLHWPPSYSCQPPPSVRR
jgi:hypothetical protein